MYRCEKKEEMERRKGALSVSLASVVSLQFAWGPLCLFGGEWRLSSFFLVFLVVLSGSLRPHTAHIHLFLPLLLAPPLRSSSHTHTQSDPPLFVFALTTCMLP